MAATVLSIIVAGASAFAAGLGSKLADEVSSSSKPLVSWSAAEEAAGCGVNSEVFLPQKAVAKALELPPAPEDFPRFQAEPESAIASSDRVNVSIQGESNRPITLTGIYFHVERRPRPPGALFVSPCGGPTEGRAIVFDLDRDPPRVVESNALLHVPLGSVDGDERALTRPIRFPWTVSLTDPLLLALIGKTESSCYCVWTAEIPWVSGSRRGVLEIDNDGEGFRMVSGHGLRFYAPGPDGWTAYPPSA